MPEYRINVIVDPTQATSGITRTTTALDQMGSSADRLRQTLTRAFAVLATAIGGREIVNTIADFGQAMSTVAAITRATRDDFEAMEATARTLGATTRFSATEAAEGMQFLARAGFEANEVVDAIGGTLNLAQSGMLSLGAAADIASNVLSGFGLAADQAGRAADVLAAAANSSNTNVLQLGEALAVVAPVAASIGISMEETAAAVGVLSDAGLQASVAGTGLRRVISGLIDPTKEAAGVINSLGLTLEQVNPETVGLSGAIHALAGAGVSAAEAFQIFGDRGAPAFLVLQEGADDVTRLHTSLEGASGEAERIARIMDDNLRGSILALRSAFEDLILTLGDAGLEAVLRGIVDGITVVIRGLSGSINTVREFVESLSPLFELEEFPLLTRGILEIQRAIQSLARSDAAEAIARTFGAISGVIRAVIDEIKGLFRFVTETPATIGDGLAVGADIAIAAIVRAFEDAGPRIRSAISSALEGAGGIFDSLVASAGNIGDRLRAAITAAQPAVLEAVREMVSQIQRIFDAPVGTDAFASLADIGRELLDQITESIERNAPRLIEVAGELIRRFSDALSAGIADFSSIADRLIGGLVEAVNNDLPDWTETAQRTISRLADAMGNVATEFGSVAISIWEGFQQALIANIPDLGNIAGTVISSLTDALLTVTSSVTDAAGAIVIELANALERNAPQYAEAAASALTNFIDALASGVPGQAPRIATIIERIAEVLITAAPKIAIAAVEILGALATALIDNIPTIAAALGEIVVALGEVIVRQAPSFGAAALQILSALADELVALAPRVGAAGVAIINALVEVIGRQTEALIQSAKDTISAWIDGALEFIEQRGAAIGEAIRGLFSFGDAGDDASETVDEAGALFDELLSQFESAAERTGERVGILLSGPLSEGYDEALAAQEAFFAEYATNVEESGSEIAEIASEAAHAAYAAFREDEALQQFATNMENIRGATEDAAPAITEVAEQSVVLAEAATATAPAIRQMVEGFSELRDRLDPAGASARAYREEMDLLNAAFENGDVGLREYQNLVDSLRESYDESVDVLAELRTALETEQQLSSVLVSQRQAELAVVQQIARLRAQGVEVTNEEIEAMRALAQQTQELIRQRQAEHRAYEALRDPAEQYREQIEALNSVLEQHPELAGRAREAFAALRLEYLESSTSLEAGFERGFLRILQEVTDFASQSENLVVNAWRNIEDALVQFATTGKLNFSDFIDSLKADLARLAIRQFLIAPILEWIGVLGQAQGSGTGFFGSIIAGAGNSEGALGSLASAIGGIGGLFTNLGGVIGGVFSSVGGLLGNLIGGITNLGSSIGNIIGGLLGGGGGGGGTPGGLGGAGGLGGLLGSIGGIFRGVTGGLTGLFGGAGGAGGLLSSIGGVLGLGGLLGIGIPFLGNVLGSIFTGGARGTGVDIGLGETISYSADPGKKEQYLNEARDVFLPAVQLLLETLNTVADVSGNLRLYVSENGGSLKGEVVVDGNRVRLNLPQRRPVESLISDAIAALGIDPEVLDAAINARIPEAASGGYVVGPGTGTSDSILARISNGEYVVNAAATARYLPLLDEINNAPRYQLGGLVNTGRTTGTTVVINDQRGTNAPPIEVRERQVSLGQREIEVTVKDMFSSGEMDAVVDGRFGVRPVPA